MPTVRSNPIPVFFIAFLLIAASPSPSQSLSVYPFLYARQFLSLSRSILTGVADLRAARGDVAGAQRARALADLYGAASEINELMRGLAELTRFTAASPSPSKAPSFYPFLYARQLLSLSRSILTGVADLRAARGDVARALTDLYGVASDMNELMRVLTELTRFVAASPSPSQSLSVYPFLDAILTGVADLRAARGNVAWYQRAWALTDLYGAASEMNELMRGLTELTRLESAAERSAWVARNYQNVVTVAKSLSGKLLKAFGQSGLLREVMEVVQKEVVEGGLIIDCLELGSNDLKALTQVLKDLVLQFYPVSGKDLMDKHLDG